MAFSLSDYQFLLRLHKDLFNRFEYVTDERKWATLEYWEPESTRAVGIEGKSFSGDCEEFALNAMTICMKNGLDARLVFVYTELGEGHCICEVASRDKTQAYFLDNRQKTLATRSTLKGYKFHSVSPWNPVPRDTRQWHRVSD